MIRLVFRPYTQIRRTICTSVSLRASTRVSPGFPLFRHRSPSFGSQQICSYSNLSQAPDRSIVPQGHTKTPVPTSALTRTPSLSLRIRVLITQILAYMLDSLVRVSRRVGKNHFVQHRHSTDSHFNATIMLTSMQSFAFHTKSHNRTLKATACA